ncbi:MAG: thioredoxin domain-containing protein [Verrucomicrobia bacterium]|nr:thioredoxin domain-containing protein [Verrucomicrobiota bacterium]
MSAPANRLAAEKSPYLLQHAANPVHWLPWGEEAFERARREDKPIFLSIGYSTCHWCHVMAHESFESEATAAILNEHFVNVKVDREERPDVDRVYMTFVQATSGSGGWPLSVWLTPRLEPFVGGTYFPPEARYGRRSFADILRAIAEAWRTNRAGILAQGEKVVGALREHAEPTAGETDLVRTEEDFSRAVDALQLVFDHSMGGFGGAPKFPRPALLRFLARMSARRTASPEVRQRAQYLWLTTLRRMAMGGLHDHLGGGFHRYSVDARWHVPHFEKMLYDQAQLALSYLEAWQCTREAFFADLVRDILGYVERDLRAPQGGFYCAEDADSLLAQGRPEHAEGAFYVWTEAEIRAALPPEEADAFCRHFDVRPGGNADPGSDPHGELAGKNTLFVSCPFSQTASELGIEAAEVERRVQVASAKLLALRKQRPRPHLDDKILTSWNGLMISAFARAGFVLGEPQYLEIARGAVEFLRREMWEPERAVLRRVWRGQPGNIAGFADDYAYLIGGLLDLYEATGHPPDLAWAEELQERQDALFGNDAPGWFSSGSADASILLRLKEDHDGAEPSVTSCGTLNLVRLAALTGREELRAKAAWHARGYAEGAERLVHSMPLMLAAQEALSRPPAQVVLAGEPADARLQALERVVAESFAPDLAILRAGGGNLPRQEYLAHAEPLDGVPAAYVCRDFACRAPLTDPTALAAELA